MGSLLKNKNVIGGIFMILFYQIAMLGIFLSGYSAIPKNVSELSVAIVNEDIRPEIGGGKERSSEA